MEVVNRHAGSVQCSVKQQAVWRRTEDHRDEQTCVLPGSHYPWRSMMFKKILVAFDGSEQRGGASRRPSRSPRTSRRRFSC